MKVYVVTSGDYSSYGIEAVCLNYEDANFLADYVNGCVEEYDTDDFSVRLQNKDKNLYWCSVDDKGLLVVYKSRILADVDLNVCHNKRSGTYGQLVYAKDEEHAKKIFTDNVAKYKAEELGL